MLALTSLWLYGISTVATLADHIVRSIAAPVPEFGPDAHFHDTYYLESARFAWVEVLMVVCGLGAVIPYLMWKYRAAVNARILDPAAMTISPGMAVGSYFIPFVQLVIPCQAMAGIARASTGSTAGVAIWWTAHVGTVLASIVIVAMNPDGLGRISVLEHGSMIVSLLTFLVSWRLVMRITRAQLASCAA
jgi:hypothetical protein